MKKKNNEIEPVVTEEIEVDEKGSDTLIESDTDIVEVDDSPDPAPEVDTEKLPDPGAEAPPEYDPGQALNYREFDYGNLMFECNRCGHREMLEQDVEGGIQITLPTTDKHNWTLTCNRCKNTMKLFFNESAKKKEVVEPESAPEVAEEEVKSTLDVVHNAEKETENEPKEESKKE